MVYLPDSRTLASCDLLIFPKIKKRTTNILFSVYNEVDNSVMDILDRQTKGFACVSYKWKVTQNKRTEVKGI
jgi:hypothetical protein